MPDVLTPSGDRASGPGAYVHADQPWSDPYLARLFDLFRFEEDLPLYLELAAAQGGRVLEIGCGTGRILFPLVEAGNSVCGLDASPHMLAVAREKLARSEAADRARLVLGDMRSLDLGEEFDLALIPTKTLAYLTSRDDHLSTLRGVAAHLRPGGLLILDLLHPSPTWLTIAPGTLQQDMVQAVPETRTTIVRTETVVRIDLAEQIRIIRSIYEIIGPDGTVTKRVVEWPYRFMYRFETEYLLERAGLTVEAIYGGYGREPFASASRNMIFVARR